MNQAVQILYRGQNNVLLMANDLGVSLDVMKSELRAYVAKTPLDEDVWRGDTELGWPWA
jgi:hypothetical protein